MKNNLGFPEKGCTYKEMHKFLISQGYTAFQNGSSHVIYRAKNKPSLSVSCHERVIAPGTWRNIYKDFNGIPH